MINSLLSTKICFSLSGVTYGFGQSGSRFRDGSSFKNLSVQFNRQPPFLGYTFNHYGKQFVLTDINQGNSKVDKEKSAALFNYVAKQVDRSAKNLDEVLKLEYLNERIKINNELEERRRVEKNILRTDGMD